MFVFEDPGHLLDTRDRELQQLSVRSYTTSWTHRKRLDRSHHGNYRLITTMSILRPDQNVSSKAQSKQVKERPWRIKNYQHNARSEIDSSSSSTSPGSELSTTTGTTAQSSPVAKTWQSRRLQSSRSKSLSLRDIDLLQTGPSLSDNEARSLQFFRERTAIDWAGWSDASFWSMLTLQASHIMPGLKHALVALASRHELLETTDSARRQTLSDFSFVQGRRALVCLNRDHNQTSVSAVLVTTIVLATYAALLDTNTYFRSVKTQNDLFDNLTRRNLVSNTESQFIATYLEPIIQRKRSQDAHCLDLIWNLERSPAPDFQCFQAVSVPGSFTNLKQARDTLEAILNFATFDKKSEACSSTYLSFEATTLLDDWYNSLLSLDQKDSSVVNRYSLALLRVCAKLNVIMIQTMDSEDDMGFDEYIDVYKELVAVVQQYETLRLNGDICLSTFGMDPGFITLLWTVAGRWCREPTIRQQLIDLLYNSNRWEGFESAAVWARTASHIKVIEESMASLQPSTCAVIPSSCRIRMIEARFYFKMKSYQVHYLTAPYRESDVQHFYIDHDDDIRASLGKSKPLAQSPPREAPDYPPDLRVGRGYMSWLDKTTHRYITTESSKFYFPLPRI